MWLRMGFECGSLHLQGHGDQLPIPLASLGAVERWGPSGEAAGRGDATREDVLSIWESR